MPIARKPIDTVPILLKRIAAVITNSGDNDPLVDRLRKIENELEGVKDLFPQFKHCEELLVSEFNSIEQDIDDDIFENGNHIDKIDEKLNSIDEKLGRIKGLVTEIRLPTMDDKPAPQGGLSEAQARNVSEDWLDLSVEHNVLVSPAMANLQLSYEVLESKLKLCLLCFAVFPEGAVIKKRPMMYWWISEGLVTKSRDKTAEEAGQEIFDNLIDKGLLEPVYKSQKSPVVYGCRVHPWIRRMLVSVATRAQFFGFRGTGEISDDYSNSRRACLVSGNQVFSGNNNQREDELLTMFNVDEQYLSFRPELFLKLRKMVVLQLGRWQNSAKHHIEVEGEEFLEDLWAQKHLKYLSLHGISRITALPSSIVECINLEILDLRACHNLERLPSDISALRKLTHLDVSECYLLESMPKGLEKLSLLQVLKGFVIGHSRKNPCKLGDLAQLKKLRKLSIHIGSQAVIEGGELIKLKEIVNLRVLTISWGGVTLPSKHGKGLSTNSNSNAGGAALQSKKEGIRLTRSATLTMESLSFPPKLEKLDLRCFPQRKLPDWLNPGNLEALKRLYIRGGPLESLGSDPHKKWKVEILRLKYLRNMVIEGSFLRTVFPDLIFLEKVRCHQIDEFQFEEDAEWNKEWDTIRPLNS